MLHLEKKEATMNQKMLLKIITIIIKNYSLSYDVVTCDVDRDVSTAYCQSSSGDEVDWNLPDA